MEEVVMRARTERERGKTARISSTGIEDDGTKVHKAYIILIIALFQANMHPDSWGCRELAIVIVGGAQIPDRRDHVDNGNVETRLDPIAQHQRPGHRR